MGKDLVGGLGNILPGLIPMLAMGGQVPNVPVEIEGNEVGQMPNGKVFEAKGPSHEEGGIDIELPEGTEMYSKRIKVDGVSMANRKKKRKKKEVTLEELLSKNKTDALLNNTFKRTKANNKKVDEADRKIQEFVKAQLEPQPKQKYALGTDIKKFGEELDLGMFENMFGKYKDFSQPFIAPKFDTSMPKGKNDYGLPDLSTNPFLGDNNSFSGVEDKEGDSNSNLTSILKNMNPADILGYLGTGISTFGPMQNTKNMRAGDTPNINPFLNFGNDALAALEQSKDAVNVQKDNAMSDINLSSASQTKRNRNSARGINQMRAMDLATSMQDKNAKAAVNANTAKLLMSLFGQQAGLENQQDQMVMQGEQMRDANDRADRDAFFSQLSKDIANKGAGLQSLGKNLNKEKTNAETLAMIEKMKAANIDAATIQAVLEAVYGLPGTNPKLVKKIKG